MSSVVSRTLSVYNSTDVDAYLTFLSSDLHAGGSDAFSDAAYYIDAKTTGYAQINSEGMNVLFPNSTAHPVKAYISAYLGRGVWWSSQTARFGLYVNDTFIWEGSTSNAGEWTRVTGDNIIDTNVINSTKSTSYKLGLYISSSNIAASVKSISLMLWFNRYDFSAVAGTGISSVEISSNQGYDGDIINYGCVVEQGYVFDGWYNGSTKVSSNQTYVHTVNGSDLSLEARAVLDVYTVTITTNIDGFVSATVNNGSSVIGLIGDTVTLSATMRTGYLFVGWYDGDTLLNTNLTYSYTITGNKTITAKARKDNSRMVVNSVTLIPKQVYVNGTSLLSVDISVEDENIDDTPYLCFTATQDNSSVTLNQVGTLTQGQEFYTSSNKNNWSQYDFGTTINLNKGDSIYWKGDNITVGESYFNYCKFIMTGTISASGNIMSLIDSSCKSVTIDSNFCYYNMFYNCTSLTTAPALPATTLAERCYYGMFEGCTSLTIAPTLPATTLAERCYYGMFWGCTSLTTAPALPATILAKYCYAHMFRSCTSLTTAPALPATTLAEYCYEYMLYDCTSLTTASALSATTLTEGCYEYMFYNCTSLTTAPALPATILAKYCYESMFRSCTSLTTAPALPATTLPNDCYHSMFRDCINLKVYSSSGTGYNKPWRIPTSGDASNSPVEKYIFYGTTGSYEASTDVSLNKTFYTQNTPV